jgi:addiction module RelB/DinJ family antitoxin
MAETVLFRTRVPAERLENVSAILDRLGMKPGDAFNMLLAQIELHQGIPFEVTLNLDTSREPLLTTEQQMDRWREAFGEY